MQRSSPFFFESVLFFHYRQITGFLFLVFFPVFSIFQTGCQPKAPELAPTKPPEVVIQRPFQQAIQEFEDFTGRTEAYRMTEIRARVSGYLQTVHFKDGADIVEGAVIAEIDPRIYKATVDKSNAILLQAEAHLKRLTSEFRRAERLTALKTITQEEFEKVAGDRSEGAAQVEAAKADLALATLNLSFARVTAPQAGRIGRRLVDPGNLIKADDTPIATIVSLDPIYASFDIDERTLLRLRRLVQDGKMKSARENDVKVQVGLADEDGFSLEGVIDFVDITLHPGTGSLKVRALVQNPNKILSPGLFVRIRLPVGTPHMGWMVPEEAMGTDQGNKMIYILNEKDEVVSKRVKQGSMQKGNREILEGIEPNDRVIISGIQRVRPGVKVTPRSAENPKPPSNSTNPKAVPASPKENPNSGILPDKNGSKMPGSGDNLKTEKNPVNSMKNPSMEKTQIKPTPDLPKKINAAETPKAPEGQNNN